MTEEFKSKRLPKEDEQEIIQEVLNIMQNPVHCRCGHTWFTQDEASRCCNGWVRCLMSGMEKFARKTTWPNQNGAFKRFLDPEKLSPRDREHFDFGFGTLLIPISDIDEINRLWRLLPDWCREVELRDYKGLTWLEHYYANAADA